MTLDSELLAMANGGVCGMCCFFFLPAKTMVDVENGAEVRLRVLISHKVSIRGF
jgi:hypothetical protein